MCEREPSKQELTMEARRDLGNAENSSSKTSIKPKEKNKEEMHQTNTQDAKTGIKITNI